MSLQNTVVASDAFFPFRDGLDVVVDQGATCVIDLPIESVPAAPDAKVAAE